MVFNEVCDDLEREGYEVQSFLIPAASVNAPHQRYRIWFVAYSNNKGRYSKFGGIPKKDGEISERNNNAEFSNTNSFNDVAYSNSARLYKQHVSTKSKETISPNRIFNEKRDFTTFPTQPPICGGDDGLPKELDSITFSKWRNQSIKAYGNAIVPQVAFEIFKAINEFESLPS